MCVFVHLLEFVCVCLFVRSVVCQATRLIDHVRVCLCARLFVLFVCLTVRVCVCVCSFVCFDFYVFVRFLDLSRACLFVCVFDCRFVCVRCVCCFACFIACLFAKPRV